MSRRAARIAAVEVLYAADVRRTYAVELMEERDDLDEYARTLVRSVSDRLAEIDALLSGHSIGWPVERMSPIDRNILRVATLELLDADVPPAAVIDEAVEIAKEWSGDEAGRFVNGVLAAVMRDQVMGQPEP